MATYIHLNDGGVIDTSSVGVKELVALCANYHYGMHVYQAKGTLRLDKQIPTTLRVGFLIALDEKAENSERFVDHICEVIVRIIMCGRRIPAKPDLTDGNEHIWNPLLNKGKSIVRIGDHAINDEFIILNYGSEDEKELWCGDILTSEIQALEHWFTLLLHPGNEEESNVDEIVQSLQDSLLDLNSSSSNDRTEEIKRKIEGIRKTVKSLRKVEDDS